MIRIEANRLREPAAWIMFAVAVTQILVTIWSILLGAEALSFAARAALGFSTLVSPVQTALLVGAVVLVTRLGEPTPRAKLIGQAAFGGLALTAVFGVVGFLAGIFGGDVLAHLLTGLPLLALTGIALLYLAPQVLPEKRAVVSHAPPPPQQQSYAQGSYLPADQAHYQPPQPQEQLAPQPQPQQPSPLPAAPQAQDQSYAPQPQAQEQSYAPQPQQEQQPYTPQPQAQEQSYLPQPQEQPYPPPQVHEQQPYVPQPQEQQYAPQAHEQQYAPQPQQEQQPYPPQVHEQQQYVPQPQEQPYAPQVHEQQPYVSQQQGQQYVPQQASYPAPVPQEQYGGQYAASHAYPQAQQQPAYQQQTPQQSYPQPTYTPSAEQPQSALPDFPQEGTPSVTPFPHSSENQATYGTYQPQHQVTPQPFTGYSGVEYARHAYEDPAPAVDPRSQQLAHAYQQAEVYQQSQAGVQYTPPARPYDDPFGHPQTPSASYTGRQHYGQQQEQAGETTAALEAYRPDRDSGDTLDPTAIYTPGEHRP